MAALQGITDTVLSRLQRAVAMGSFSIASALVACAGPAAEQPYFTACATLGSLGTCFLLMAAESARTAREEQLDELLLTRSSCEEARRHAANLARLGRRRSLARQLDGIVRDANTCSLGLRMMLNARTVRRFGPRLNRLADMLRDPGVAVPGEAVLLTRLLLMPGRSPMRHVEPDEDAARRLLDRIEQEIRGAEQLHAAA
jgi:hypothetical protein